MDRITADNHKISDPAVKKATGCTWSEWFQAIKERRRRAVPTDPAAFREL